MRALCQCIIVQGDSDHAVESARQLDRAAAPVGSLHVFLQASLV